MQIIHQKGPMTQAYPLYDELLKRVRESEDKTLDVRKICTSIKSIGQTNTPDQVAEHYREIGALIIHHVVITTGGLPSIPFEGKVMIGGKGLLFQVTNLPTLLQQIIWKYLEDPNLPPQH